MLRHCVCDLLQSLPSDVSSASRRRLRKRGGFPPARAAIVTLLTSLMATSAACGGSAGQSQGPQQAGPPPAGVSIITLAPKPIPETSESIAAIRSLRSTTVQPEGEGIVTKILVKAGDHVRVGTPLVQIDPAKQLAAVRSAEANLSGTAADVEYWRGQVKRLEALLSAGAISRQEFDQAQNSLRTAEARLAALEAEVREGKVQLGYYLVEARQSGTVGEIPIRTGDRVTTSTVITTIDDNTGYEAYIQVPLDRSTDLRLGLPVELLDGDGKVIATNPITFVAPRVDDATQTVLAKSALKQTPASIRVQQFVRVRIIWRTAQGLTVPLTAVTRISGQYFCFVAEPGPQGGLVARQRPLQVGEVVGNDYMVKGGVKAGERLIVSGIQKLGDGAPVQAQ
jgi:RND family efflux transporter MFP subunit